MEKKTTEKKREKTLYTFEVIGILVAMLALAFLIGVAFHAGIHFYYWLINL